MGTTARYQLPYPTNTDAPDGPAQLQALAEATEDALATDTGDVVNSGVTAGSGWSLNTSTYRVVLGKLIFLYVSLERTGGDITANSSGNIGGDPLVATVTNTSLRPSTQVIGLFRASDTAGSVRLKPDGAAQIGDAHSNSDIVAGNSLYFSLTYLIGGTA